MVNISRIFLPVSIIALLISCSTVPVNTAPMHPQESVNIQGNYSVRPEEPAAADLKVEPPKTALSELAPISESRDSNQDGESKIRKDQVKKEASNKHKKGAADDNTASTKTSEDLQEQQETLDQALELLNQSQGFWQKVDIDNALRCLDEAYALILEVNGDPEIARQKDDLRVIISKRIVEISTTRYTIAKGMQSEIPMILNADVEREIRSFQTVERGFFLRSYQRSGQFRPAILKYLQEAGLPKELSWLPLVESGFQCSALSSARALGLWQFIPSTGYKYALQRDSWVDERLDPEKSTRAAIAYMQELHGMFGDWLTCLAAYNCGEGRVLRVIAKQRINYLDHFWDLYRQLPNETARYVPRFLATLHIIKDPKKYGMDLSEDLDKPIPYELVKVEKSVRLQDVAQAMNVSKDVMTALNSELKLQTTPDKVYSMKLPSGMADQFAACIDDIPRWEPPRPKSAAAKGAVLIRHKVKKGESLAGIARRYKTSTATIIECNDLANNKVSPGQVIRVPGRGYVKKVAGDKQKSKGKSGKKEEQADNGPAEKIITYKVKKGDTMSALAKRYGVTMTDIRKLNGISGGQLNVDQVIKIKDNNS